MSVHAASFLKPPQKASILILTAHRWEAEPFLAGGGLTVSSDWPFPVWTGENGVVVGLTGIGPVRAAAAGGALLARFSPCLVANFGVAGAYPGHHDIGGAVLLNKVVDGASGRSYYPDRLLPSDLREATCTTVTTPATLANTSESSSLFDMEAAGVTAAAELFLPTSRILLGKVVSDHLAEAGADLKSLRGRIEVPYREAARGFLDLLWKHHRILGEEPRAEAAREAEEWVEKLLGGPLSALHLTVSQRRRLAGRLRAFALAESDPKGREEKLLKLRTVIDSRKGETKGDHTKLLDRLLQELATPPLFSPLR